MEFKILLIGANGVGKTTWLRKLLNRGWSSKYIPTIGRSVITLKLYTDAGEIVYHIHDTAGTGIFQHELYVNEEFDGVLLMFDLGSIFTFNQLNNLHPTSHNITVLIGNKSDVLHKVTAETIASAQLPYCEISTKRDYFVDSALLILTQMLMNDKSIKIKRVRSLQSIAKSKVIFTPDFVNVYTLNMLGLSV